MKPAGKDAAGLPSEMVQNLSKDVVSPLAHDIAENARPQTEEFIEKVLKPAVADLTATMQSQAEEIAEKVCCTSRCHNSRIEEISGYCSVCSKTCNKELFWGKKGRYNNTPLPKIYFGVRKIPDTCFNKLLTSPGVWVL